MNEKKNNLNNVFILTSLVRFNIIIDFNKLLNLIGEWLMFLWVLS
jgi:hypothetical protein